MDYASKRVTLRSKDDVDIIIVGERQDYLSNVISTLVDKKLVRKGCEAFLAYMFDMNFVESAIGDIWTLDREVEFGIEVLPRTSSVSIAPYRMASKKHFEFKV